MSITRGAFLRSLGKSLPGMVASTGVATAAEALIRRIAQASPAATEPPAQPVADLPFLEHGSGEGSQIALTFDDGPVPGVTELILDELKKRGLHATFFMIGEKVAVAPELARRVVVEGHEIGNHTFTHAKLSGLSDDEVDEELEKTERVFAEQLKSRAAWFRPPFGAFRRNQAPLVTRRGLGVALWSVDPEDWRGTGGTADKILAQTEAGSIILCHELSETAACLGRTLDGLQGKGFHFGTISSFSKPSGN